MSKKKKSISDLVFELQAENDSLKNLKRLADSFCRQEFGYNIHELHQVIEKLNIYERKSQERDANMQGQHLSLSRSE